VPARHHLVQHRAERPEIGARVGVLAFELLGRHVRQCPDDRPARGDRVGPRQRRRVARERGALAVDGELCEAEVEQLGGGDP
jgi:hypothetical protein